MTTGYTHDKITIALQSEFRLQAFNNLAWKPTLFGLPLRFIVTGNATFKQLQGYLEAQGERDSEGLIIACDTALADNLLCPRIWWNTVLEVPPSLVAANNFFVVQNFNTRDANIQLWPTRIKESEARARTSIVYISEVNLDICAEAVALYTEQGDSVFFDFLDDSFWENRYNYCNNQKKAEILIGLGNLFRYRFISHLSKFFPAHIQLGGSNWRDYGLQTIEYRDFDTHQRRQLYNGNLCIDFLSKSGFSALYQRTIEIIESGGLPLIPLVRNSIEMFPEYLLDKISFSDKKSLSDLIDYYLSNPGSVLIMQRMLKDWFQSNETSFEERARQRVLGSALRFLAP